MAAKGGGFSFIFSAKIFGQENQGQDADGDHGFQVIGFLGS